MNDLVLSLFHGIDIFGKGFEAENFFVVRAAEIELASDVRDLHLPENKFDGIIAGTPCQDFSLANRTKRTYEGYGAEMLEEFCRLVIEAAPKWFLLENVPQVPDIHIFGYTIQRFDLRASECGLNQRRLRHFQFGSRDGSTLVIEREPRREETEKTCLASEGEKKSRRNFADFCKLQGLPDALQLPMFTKAAKYRLVGNAVPFPMARMIARAIRERPAFREATADRTRYRITVCACNCGRRIENAPAGRRRIYANDSCRKRGELKRKRESATAKS
jgi:DNA (cytosine-5)-methyltransferase 1